MAEHDQAIASRCDTASIDGHALEWLERAATLPGKMPLEVALAVLRLAVRLDRSRHILITSSFLAGRSFNRTTAYRAFRELEGAGLLTVRRCQGRPPLVSIAWPEAFGCEHGQDVPV